MTYRALRSPQSSRCRPERLPAAVVVLAVILLAAPFGQARAAGTSFSWRPGGLDGNTHRYEWSNPANWSGTAPTNDSSGAFTFGAQPDPCADTAQGSCDNDLSGLTATSLTIDTGSGYVFTGHAITLSGPVTARASGLRDPTWAAFEFPLTLIGDQRWSVSGSPKSLAGADVPSGLTFLDPLTGSSSLAVAMQTAGRLELDADSELGAVTLSGGSSGAGAGADANGSVLVTDSLNGTDGAPVTVDHVGLAAGVPGRTSSATIGALHLVGGDLQVGNDGVEDASGLTVNGGVAADSASRMTFLIDGPSAVAGGDYAQLSASGPVSLAGALDLRFGVETGVSCQPPEPGTRYTLITTTGALSGTFSGVPGGSVIAAHAICPDGGIERTAPVRIDYTPNAVIGSVVGTATVAASIAPNPSNAGQPVTLSATVTAGYGDSSGTVNFTSGPQGSPVPGCTGVQTTTGFNGQSTAQCATSSLHNGEVITAAYVPDARSFAPSAQSAPMTASVTESRRPQGQSRRRSPLRRRRHRHPRRARHPRRWTPP